MASEIWTGFPGDTTHRPFRPAPDMIATITRLRGRANAFTA
jgi:hypothetical protein